MRAWVLATFVIGLSAGCCADTYEIDADRSQQAIGTIVYGTPQSGIVRSTKSATTLRVVLGDGPTYAVTFRFPPSAPGDLAGQLAVLDATDVMLDTFAVTVTPHDLQLVKVCMSDDQNDYGTGRCGYSFTGSLDIAGTSAMVGAVTATWVLHQIAVVVPGTPDC